MNYPFFIYELRNKANGKIYIGMTANPNQRFHKHLYDMKSGKHPVPLMNEDFAKYGSDSFEFNVIDTVHNDDEVRKEKYWQLKLRTREPEFGYNYKEDAKHIREKDVEAFSDSPICCEKIYRARREKGMTIEDLAGKCGVQKSAVSKWEKGRVKTLSYTRLIRIAAALDCAPNELIRGE